MLRVLLLFLLGATAQMGAAQYQFQPAIATNHALNQNCNACTIAPKNETAELRAMQLAEKVQLVTSIPRIATLIHFVPAWGRLNKAPQKSLDEQIQFFPNPVTNQLTVQIALSQPSWTRISLYDALGREVAVVQEYAQIAGLQRYIYSPAKLVAGMYYLRFELDGRTKVQPVLIGRAY